MILLRLTAVLACALPLSALAQPDTQALIDQGLELRRQGRDAEAAEVFRRAHAIDGAPRTLAQLALAEQGSGAWAQAERDLVAAMAASDPWIVEHQAVLAQALAVIRSHLGRLIVVSSVPGAELLIGGRVAGTLPLSEPISVEVGTTVLTVRASGYMEVQRPTTIRAGELTRESIELVPAPRTPDAQPDPPPEPDPEPEPIPVPVVPPPSSGLSTLVLLGLGGAAASALLLTGTLIATAVRESAVQQWNDDAMCPPGAPGGRVTTCPAALGTLRSAEDWAIGLGIATGVAAAASAALIVLGLGEGAPATASLQVSPHGGMLSVTASF